MIMSKDLRQALALQHLCFEIAEHLGQELLRTDSVAAKLSLAQSIRHMVGGWNTARDGARVLRNRPLPGSLRPEAGGPRRMKIVRQSFSEPGAASGIVREPAQLPAPLDKPIANVT